MNCTLYKPWAYKSLKGALGGFTKIANYYDVWVFMMIFKNQ